MDIELYVVARNVTSEQMSLRLENLPLWSFFPHLDVGE